MEAIDYLDTLKTEAAQGLLRTTAIREAKDTETVQDMFLSISPPSEALLITHALIYHICIWMQIYFCPVGMSVQSKCIQKKIKHIILVFFN